MVKKFLLLILTFLSVPVILFSACDTPTVCDGGPQPPAVLMVKYEPEYNLDEDITVKISVDLKGKTYNDPDLKYVAGCSFEKEITSATEYTTLLSITDFPNDKYIFTEEATINKEFFGDDSQTNGQFYFFLYATQSDEDRIFFMMWEHVQFEKNENILKLFSSKKAN